MLPKPEKMETEKWKLQAQRWGLTVKMGGGDKWISSGIDPLPDLF